MQQMKKVVTMYGPHSLFTKKLLNAMASSIRNFVPYDWQLLIRALLKPREYLQWTMWFQDVTRDRANSNAWAGTPQNQITFEMLTSTGQFDATEGQIQSPPWWKTILTITIVVILFLLFAFYICNYIMNFVSEWLRHLSYKWLFMLWQFPQPPLAITQGPWIKDPQYEDEENMLPQQFRVYAPSQQEEVTEPFLHPFPWQPYSSKSSRKW